MQSLKTMQKVWAARHNQHTRRAKEQRRVGGSHQLRCEYAVFNTSSATIVQKPKMIATRKTAISRCTVRHVAGYQDIGIWHVFSSLRSAARQAKHGSG